MPTYGRMNRGMVTSLRPAQFLMLSRVNSARRSKIEYNGPAACLSAVWSSEAFGHAAHCSTRLGLPPLLRSPPLYLFALLSSLHSRNSTPALHRRETSSVIFLLGRLRCGFIVVTDLSGRSSISCVLSMWTNALKCPICDPSRCLWDNKLWDHLIVRDASWDDLRDLSQLRYIYHDLARFCRWIKHCFCHRITPGYRIIHAASHQLGNFLFKFWKI